jgi:hypothetical protein
MGDRSSTGYHPFVLVVVGGGLFFLLSMLLTSKSKHQALKCSNNFLVPGYVESYSLWMMPGANSFQTKMLKKEIDTNAASYTSPRFLPHVTLLPDIKMTSDKVIETTREMVLEWRSDEHVREGWRASFQKIKKGKSFFQCVFILCEMDPTVMQAATIARRVFKMERLLGPYMPHLSLIYADMTEQEKDDAVTSSELRLLVASNEAKRKFKVEGFSSEKVSIWYTPTEDKTLESWCWIADIDV